MKVFYVIWSSLSWLLTQISVWCSYLHTMSRLSEAGFDTGCYSLRARPMPSICSVHHRARRGSSSQRSDWSRQTRRRETTGQHPSGQIFPIDLDYYRLGSWYQCYAFPSGDKCSSLPLRLPPSHWHHLRGPCDHTMVEDLFLRFHQSRPETRVAQA